MIKKRKKKVTQVSISATFFIKKYKKKKKIIKYIHTVLGIAGIYS